MRKTLVQYPNFKFQFHPLSSKIEQDKNLIRLIEFDKGERANGKKCVMCELRSYSLLQNTF